LVLGLGSGSMDERLCVRERSLVLDAVAMQIVAVGVEPVLGALAVTADLCDDPPEPRRMVHLDKMGHFMSGEVIQHVWRCEDQPPGNDSDQRLYRIPSGSTDRESTGRLTFTPSAWA